MDSAAAIEWAGLARSQRQRATFGPEKRQRPVPFILSNDLADIADSCERFVMGVRP